MFTSVVELTDILSFIGDFKRPLIEGTQVMKCNHIVEFGCVENNTNTLRIVAMCLKTSDLSGKPHELEVIKTTVNGNSKLSGKCSCKAGSGKCKHIVGLMLKLQKTPIEELDERSCTDLPQQWGKLGQAASKYLHKPVPVGEFCHVFPITSVYDKSLPNDISEDLQQEIRSYFLQRIPNSAFAMNHVGRIEPLSKCLPTLSASVVKLIETFITSYNSCMENSCFSSHICDPSDISFYYSKVDVAKAQAIEICFKTKEQNGPYWKKIRQIRITGTSAYGFFTKSKSKTAKKDWDSKIKSVLFSNFSGNAATRYGILNENKAIATFEEKYEISIIKLGFLININCPWLGISPDGFIEKLNEYVLIEIKCPIAGKKFSGSDLIIKLKYIKISNECKLTLNKNHSYYGQIQLGLLLCNLKMAYLVIYASVDNSIIVIDVHFDPVFSKQMFTHLTDVYFKHVLPYINQNVNI